MAALYIIDLDGTLADDRARKLKAGPEPLREDRDAYLTWLAAIQSDESLAADLPVPGMPELVRGLARDQAVIIYLTAREEKYRDTTRQWLIRYNFPKSLLIMRPNGAWMSSRALKEAHLLELKAAYPHLALVAIDDDGSGDCADMYLEHGIPHLHVKLSQK